MWFQNSEICNKTRLLTLLVPNSHLFLENLEKFVKSMYSKKHTQNKQQTLHLKKPVYYINGTHNKKMSKRRIVGYAPCLLSRNWESVMLFLCTLANVRPMAALSWRTLVKSTPILPNQNQNYKFIKIINFGVIPQLCPLQFWYCTYIWMCKFHSL